MAYFEIFQFFTKMEGGDLFLHFFTELIPCWINPNDTICDIAPLEAERSRS